VDVVAVARELYLLVPADFTAARNARAKETTDRALAAELRALPKASASAWTVDQLASRGAELSDRFAKLGAALREAQDRADRAELTKLIAERRTVVGDTMKVARSLARDHSIQLSAAAVDEVEQSLLAALADEAGFAAVFSGRLIRPVRSDGLEATDLSGAIGGPEVAVSSRKRHPATAPTKSPAPTAAAQKKRKVEIERARRAANDADAAVRKVDDELSRVESDQDEVAAEFESLRAQLDSLTTRQKQLDDRAKQLAKERIRTRETARRAHRAMDEAGR
jgi:hypothetical protein